MSIPFPQSEPENIVIPPKHELVGALNNEARCLLYLAIPSSGNYVALSAVREGLTKVGAFSIERGAKRFNVQELSKQIGEPLLFTYFGPDASGSHGDSFVKKPCSISGLGNALAEGLADHSATYGFPIRSIFGERRVLESNRSQSSIEVRLAVLSSILALHDDSTTNIPKSEIRRLTNEKIAVEPTAVARHLRKLIRVGLLEDDENKRRIRFAPTLPSGIRPLDIIRDAVSIVDELEVGAEPLTERGARILERPNLVQVLLRRSYSSTLHTNKPSPRTK